MEIERRDLQQSYIYHIQSISKKVMRWAIFIKEWEFWGCFGRLGSLEFMNLFYILARYIETGMLDSSTKWQLTFLVSTVEL